MTAEACEPGHEPRHPIQVVSRRTGLSPDLIRIWERRYGAVEPGRGGSGRRLYSDADVERLLLLRRATEAGRRIGEVARLSAEGLAALVADDQTAAPPRFTRTEAPGSASLQACLEAARRLDPAALHAVLAEAGVAMSVPRLLEELIAPFMREIGRYWRDGSLRIYQEHMASAVVRSFLGQLIRSVGPLGAGPRLLVATPPGQGHELGALMAALTAAAEGWRPLYLGANTPAGEIAAAARQAGARAVALSLTYPADDPQLAEELRLLRRHLPAETALLVGGAAAGGYEGVLEEISAQRLRTLAELRMALGALRRTAG